MKAWKKELIIFSLCAVFIFLYIWNLKRTSPNHDDSKLREVQELSGRLSVFPGFTQVGSSTKSGYTVVDITKHYSSKADVTDVKAFYLTLLKKDGWTLSHDDLSTNQQSGEIRFSKGQFSVSVFHSRDSVVYDYAIDFAWDSQGKL